MSKSTKLKQAYNFYYFKYQKILNKYNLLGSDGSVTFEHISFSDAFKFSFYVNTLSFINAKLNNKQNIKLNALVINNIFRI